MQFSSQSLETLVEEFSHLPGVGRKTAQRMAFFMLKTSKDDALRLANAIAAIKEQVRECDQCGNFTEEAVCLICRDFKRDHSVICVVEQGMDVLAVESSGGFRGIYHVLGGSLNPLEHVGPDDIRAKELVARAQGEAVKEIILATNPNPSGEATAHFLKELLDDTGVEVTRIARGIPVGGDLEYTDSATMARALEGRKSAT